MGGWEEGQTCLESLMRHRERVSELCCGDMTSMTDSHPRTHARTRNQVRRLFRPVTVVAFGREGGNVTVSQAP